MKANNASDKWQVFIEHTEKLDATREENFWRTFPELHGIT